MKNPDEEVNIGAFDPKKLYIRGGGGGGGGVAGLLTYTWVITEIYHPTLILSDDDVIYGR